MKNLKSTLCNFGLIALSILILGFMACPYLEVGDSGYLYLGFIGEVPGLELFIASIILDLIFVLFMLIAATISVLISFELIKNDKLEKILTFIEIGLAGLLIIFNFISMVYVSSKGAPIAYGFILNLIVSIGLLAVSLTKYIFALIKKK